MKGRAESADMGFDRYKTMRGGGTNVLFKETGKRGREEEKAAKD